MSCRPRTRGERRRLVVALVLLVFVIVGVVLVGRFSGDQQPAANVAIAGPEEIVFDWSEQACEPIDFPDVPARAFRDASGQTQLIASLYINRRMIGPDLDHLTHDCTVIMASDDDPDPARFSDREWIHAVYTLDGKRIFALVHDEYQGHRHQGRCPSGEYRKCWFNAITLAISEDGGASYHHAEPPAHLIASVPYPYEPDAGPFGVFNPSNIVHNPNDGYFYALVYVSMHQEQQDGICVMRTADLADPASWRAWDGATFSISFINPYATSNELADDHVCQPVAREEIQTMRHGLSFNTYLDRFLIVGIASSPNPVFGDPTWGIYYSLSNDLIHWTPRRLIIEHVVPASFECGGPSPIGFPSVLDPDSPSRNFETTDRQFYLYFVRINYTSCEPTHDRDLVRVPIDLSR